MTTSIHINLPSLLTVLAAVCTSVCAAPADAQLLWSDEFDDGVAPDPQHWSYDLGANGWGNQELQEYTDDLGNARIANGNLVITAKATAEGTSPAPFSSARLRTDGKVEFKYGTIEARIRVPDLARGLWPAFWTLGGNFSEVGWPFCGELDILEMGWRDAVRDGVVNRWLSSAAHWESSGQYAFFGRTYSPELVEPNDLTASYHLFSMNWTPNTITTFLDGNEIWTMDISAANCTDCEEFHQPHFMILNLAVGGTFTGQLTESQITAPLPAEMHVDYVRIYDNGFTELSGTGIEPDPSIIGPAHSGSWFPPSQSGHGFSMEFGQTSSGAPLAVVYWYIYDDQGNPMFMVGTGTPEDDRVTITFESPVGMIFGEFDPDSVIREVGGTGEIVFTDRDNAAFSYSPSNFTANNWGHGAIVDLPLIKLFGIDAAKSFSEPGQ